MVKVLMVVCAVLLVVSSVFAVPTANSEYLGVPTAEGINAGQISVAVSAVENTTAAYGVEFGLTENLSVFANGSTDPFALDNVVGGVKYIAGRRTVDNSAQLAIFAYNLGEDLTVVPGFAVTVKPKQVNWLSYTASAWFENDTVNAGFGATATLTRNINLQAEWQTDDDVANQFAYGVGLQYKNLFGKVLYLNDTEEFYGQAGISF